MIEYLLTQLDRMSGEQVALVRRCAKLPAGRLQKAEIDRLTKLYIWLHMKAGSVAQRRF